MTVSVLTALPITREEDAFGNILGGGLLYTFQANSDIPLATYQDINCLVPNTNPVKLDATGRAFVRYLPQAYKLKLTDAAGTVLWTVDNYWPPITAEPVSFSALIQASVFPQTAAEAAAGVTPVDPSYPAYDARRYGVVSDNQTNNDIAITAALAVLTASRGGILRFPAGTALFSNTIVMPANSRIMGVSAGSTVLSYIGATLAVSFKGAQSARCGLENLTLQGAGAAIGIQIGDTDFCGKTDFSNLYISGFSAGLRLAAALWATFDNCYFTGNVSTDISINAGSASMFSTTVTFNECQFIGSPRVISALYVPITNQMFAFNECSFQATFTPQLSFHHPGGPDIGGLNELVIDGCYIEGTPTQDVFDMGIVGPFRVSNCYCNGCNQFAYDSIGGGSGQGFIFNNSILNAGATGDPIHFISDPDIIEAMNSISSGAPNVTGTGSASLSGQGIASWPKSLGSFVPTLTATSGAPTYVAGSTNGLWDQIGNRVSFTATVVISAVGTLSGSLAVNLTGLPLAQNNVSSGYVFPVYAVGVTAAGNNNSYQATLARNTNTLAIIGTGTATPAGVLASAIASSTTLIISGSYHV